MTFLTPLTGIIAGAIGVPLLVTLYFLKLRRRKIQVSSTLLWRKAVQDLQANAPFQKLRKNILLLLQLLILAGLIFALMQPEVERQGDLGTRHVIMLDRSASMGALDASGRTRLERSREKALEFVQAMRTPGPFSSGRADEAMVVSFDVNGEVLTQFTSDKSALTDAINAVTLGSGSSSLADVMRLVRAQAPQTPDAPVDEEGGRLPDAGVGTLHLYTDGRLPDAAEAMTSARDEVIYYAPDDVAPFNVGIVSLQAARGFDDPSMLSVFVGVAGSVRTQTQVDVQIRIGDQERIFPVTLTAAAETPDAASQTEQPPATGSTTITLSYPASAVVEARLVGREMSRDVLAVDNVGWLVVAEARRLKVACVTSGNIFLSNALRGMALAELTMLTASEFEARLRARTTREFDVIVFDRYFPPVDESVPLPPGRYLVLGDLPPPPLGPVVEGDAEQAQFTLVSREHPLTRGLVLDSVLISAIRQVTFTRENSIRTLAMTDLGPGIIECWAEDVRLIATTFDPLNSTWPFDVSFPLFVADAIDYLVSESRGTAEASRQVRPGEVLVDRIPAAARNVRITEPNEQGRPVGSTFDLTPAPDGRIVFGPIRATGIYEVSWEGPAAEGDSDTGGRKRRYFASNLLDAMESDIAVPGQLALASKVVIAADQSTTTVRDRLWRWFILGALLIVLFEWYVFNRKVHL